MKNICLSMMKINYETTDRMFNNLQNLIFKTILNFHRNIGKYYGEMYFKRKRKTLRLMKTPLLKKSQSIANIHLVAILLIKILQTKSQVKRINWSFFDLYFNVINNFTQGGENWDLR